MKPFYIILFILTSLVIFINSQKVYSEGTYKNCLIIKKSPDFEVTGKGSSKNWKNTNWVVLPKRNNGHASYETKVKILYSETGIYFLFYCEDDIINSTINKDNKELYKEDVIEVFLWTDEQTPIYFEYELSPQNHELPLIVPNFNGDFFGWLPWQYEGIRKTRHATSFSIGSKTIKEENSNWTGEFFIPFELLNPLQNVPPTKGTKWRANMYRIDFDKGKTTFSWQEYKNTFHDYTNFGTIYFE